MAKRWRIMRTWLVIGIPENWHTALAQPIPLWGLRKSYRNRFALLGRHDILVLYATSPVKGCIGVGRVMDKYVDDKTCLWQEEKQSGKTIWPLRFRFEAIHLLEAKYWRPARSPRDLGPVSVTDLKLNWQMGFQELPPEIATNIIERVRQQWQVSMDRGATIVDRPEPAPTQLTVADKLESGVTLHRDLQDAIAEAGRLQHFFSQTEYPVELSDATRKLDVVWKRESQGVPAFAFEVELSGNIEKSVVKLQIAHMRWNSAPRLVVPRKYIETVSDLVERQKHDFRESFVCVVPDTIQELLEKKKGLREFERATGIY
jgi:hypothetical protein